MGWSSGSALMHDVIEAVKKNVRITEKRVNIYYDLIQAFQERDADTLGECLDVDPAYDQAYAELLAVRRT